MMRSTSQPRHRNHPVAGLRCARTRGLLAGGAGFAAAVVLALGATGGTYAYLNDSATATTGEITAGTGALAVAGSPVSLTGLYPTAVKYAAITVTNTGSTALQLRVDSLAGPTTATALSASLTVGVGVAASAAACTSGATTSTWTGTFAAAPAGALGSTLAAGASATICVSTSMAANAATTTQSASTGYTLTLGGRQP